MLKTGFTVVTLLVFSYAMIYAENFQGYDQLVFANGSGLDEQVVKDNNDMVIDLEDVVVDEWDDLGIRRITYTVRRGDTPSEIARQFGITTKNLKLVNKLESDTLKIGSKLIITPVEWFVIQNTAGDMTVEQFAVKHRLDLQDFRELNDYSSNLDMIKNGYEIFIPLTIEEGIKLWFIQPEPDPVVTPKPSTSNTKNNQKPAVTKAAVKPAVANVKKVGKAYYSKAETSSTLGFAAGNCTSYVAKKKPDIAKAIRAEGGWHAKYRYSQASKAGLSVGKTPAVWSVWVMGTTYGYYGHVWVVVSVDDDEVCMNNANVRWWWVVSQDCFPRKAFIGYIY